MSILILISASVGLIMSLRSQAQENDQTEVATPQEKPLDEQVKEAWIDGCVKHTMEEVYKVANVANEQAARAKAVIYCTCDWSYMRDPMGLSFEDIASIGQEGSRGSSAIVEAQNYCFERYKDHYYP